MILSGTMIILGIITLIGGVGMSRDEYPVAGQLIYAIGMVVACCGSFALGAELVDAGYIQFPR